ncbi:MAG: type II toxin-antitoxin system VapC family toxin [Dehalococcoidia bacterium]
MKRFLLDANVVMNWLKGKEPALSLVRHILQGPYEVAVNAIVLAEVHTGVADKDRESVGAVLEAFDYWPIEEPVARLAGQYRWGFARQGKQFDVQDMLIGAHARYLDETLVTDNIRDFPIPGLKLLRPGDPLP